MQNFIPNKLFYLSLVILIILSSCIPQKRILLMQDKKHNKDSSFILKLPMYKIKIGDELYIRVNGLDDKSFALFNGLPVSMSDRATNYAGLQSGGNIFLTSYTVNDSGYIYFPYINKIYVKDFTVDQIRMIIQDSINNYVNFGTVMVKLVNYKITFLGEVRSPGQVDVQNDRINIFEAIALAGDLSEYANKNKVAVARKTDDGTVLKYLDLTDRYIFKNEYYYLMPGDVVYIGPMSAKPFGLRNFQLGTFLTLITSLLALYSIITR
jgi:polysaccharide biosynthesis/export protein